MAARQSYRSYDIECIGLIRGEHNPADCLTKPVGNGALRRLMETGRDETPVESWIIRERAEAGDDVGAPGATVDGMAEDADVGSGNALGEGC